MQDTFDAAAVADYYRRAAAPLLRQLADRVVHAVGWGAESAVGGGRTDDQDALTTQVLAGARWFSWDLGSDTPGVVQIGVGEGADIATAATAALALVQDLQQIGVTVVPASDGQGGLLVYSVGQVGLAAVVAALAERAPEIATAERDHADGRAWLVVPEPGTPVPVPYSLVDSVDGTGLVLPLTVDELAAVTAGMPLDPEPDDLADRLVQHGDLAAVLGAA